MTVSVETEQQWPIPAGLSPQGLTAATVIRDFLQEKGLTYHGGGGKFYTSEEWIDRGEQYGTNSVLVITHDGGDHAVALDWDYGAYAIREELTERLGKHGLYVEECTSWFSAVYPV